MKPTAHLVIDSTKIKPDKLKKIEDALYGTADAPSKLLMPNDIIAIMNAAG